MMKEFSKDEEGVSPSDIFYSERGLSEFVGLDGNRES